MNASSEIVIRDATKEDFDGIRDCYSKYYWPHEPTSSGFKVKTLSDREKDFWLKIPTKGLSVVAADPEQGDKIVGFLANDALRPGVEKKLNKILEENNDVRMEAIFGIFNKLNNSVDIFEKYGVDKALLLFNLAVDPAVRGRSIGKRLFEKSFEVAKSNGFKMVVVDCSSFFSTQIAKNLGMELITEIYYKDYVDGNGEPIFQPEPIHTHVTRFIKFV